jgi:hypothetical protein
MAAAHQQAGAAVSGDDPACWSWPVPEAESPEQFIARVDSENAALTDPDQRRADPRLLVRYTDLLGERFRRFHRGCAACGGADARVLDHCHDSGQVRGYLCRGCNVLEGRSQWPVIVRYRQRHPAAILGYHEPYSGAGWANGWSLVERRGSVRELGRRPATPWPPLPN